MGFFGQFKQVKVDGVPFETIGNAARAYRIPVKMLKDALSTDGVVQIKGHRFEYCEEEQPAPDFNPNDWGYEINGMVYRDTIQEAAEFAFVNVKRLTKALSQMKSATIEGFKFQLVPRRKTAKVHDAAWKRKQSQLLNGYGVERTEHRGVKCGCNITPFPMG